ncbi:MAG: hypothetical protein EAX81_04155 [Candidatus Thorarchaeota archaeon]|nr:hypothetical protein [Candidatus Thorarchaeota archaeon]
MLQIILAIVIAFLVVFLSIPRTIEILKEKGIIGVDVHKPNQPEVAKGGGFIVLFAIVAALLVVIGFIRFQAQEVNSGLLAALVSILMAGMIGLLDDILDFNTRTKIVLPLIASIPMLVMQVGTTTMSIPIIGTVDLGVIYPLVIVPLMMTFIIDSTNMYGGMNGLETGLATINASSLLLYILFAPLFTNVENTSQLMDAGIVSGALLGAALAFMFFNKCPARILPGDVGRLPLGATMAAALILGNMDRLAVILYIPFLINFMLYLLYRIHVKRTRMEYIKFATPRNDGTLEVPGPFTMYWLLPYLSNGITEKRNVILLLLLQAILAYGGVVILLFGIPF